MSYTTKTGQETSFCRILIRTVSQYLQDKEHRSDFEKWYEEKYGEKYIWKGCVTNAKPSHTA